MKVLLFFLAASTAFSAGWDAVQRIPKETKVEVLTRDSANVRGRFVSAHETVMVMRS